MARTSFIRQIYRNKNDCQGIVFLDRDGTINKEVNYLRDEKQIQILPHVSEGIALLNKENIRVIVITNQPAVARGYTTISGLKKINNTLVSHLKKKNAYIDAIYSCPHHPERYHPNIPPNAMKYRIKCSCRKPKLAMFRQALRDFKVNTKKAFVVGDRTGDIKAGKNLKITTFLVETGFGGRDNKYSIAPDYIVCDLYEAIDIILNH